MDEKKHKELLDDFKTRLKQEVDVEYTDEQYDNLLKAYLVIVGALGGLNERQTLLGYDCYMTFLSTFIDALKEYVDEDSGDE